MRSIVEGNRKCIILFDLSFNFSSASFVLNRVENSGSMALLSPFASRRTSGNSLAPYLNHANTAGSRYTADTITPSVYWADPLISEAITSGSPRYRCSFMNSHETFISEYLLSKMISHIHLIPVIIRSP